jgi:hypothetical protein
VHRPPGEQYQDGRSHVAATSAARAAPTPTATWASETESETGAEATAETGAEAGAETERSVVVCGLFAQVLEEFPPCVPLGAVQGPPLGRAAGAKVESEAWASCERSAGRSEWSVHVLKVLCL